MSQPQPSSSRIHGLDAYRAVLMTAGVWLHVAIPYFGQSEEGLEGLLTEASLGILTDWIHLFRMPAFFVLSGFFSAMLWVRGGTSSLFLQRFKRIGLPFALFVCLLNPLFSFMEGIEAQLYAGAETTSEIVLGSLFHQVQWYPNSTMHLWFLYLLLYINPLVVGLNGICTRIPLPWDTLKARTKWVLEKPFLSVSLIVLIDLIWRFFFQWESLPTTTEWVPDLTILAYYVGCFGLGWVIYRCEVDLFRLTGGWITNLLLFFVISPLLFIRWGIFESMEAYLHLDLWAMEFEAKVGMSLLIVSSSLGMVTITRHTAGLFLRLLKNESGFWRYASDSAYWIYIIHIPFAFLVPELIRSDAIPVLIQYVLAVGLVTLLCVITYDALVRNRWLGVLLNGRRYEPKAPRLTTGLTVLGTVLLVFGITNFNPPLDFGWKTDDPAAVAGPDATYPYPEATETKRAGTCLRMAHLVYCPVEIHIDDISAHCERIGAAPYLKWSADDIVFLNERLAKLTERDVWVPLDERAKEDEWRWADGTLASDVPFSPGEPNDWRGNDEDCVWANHEDLNGWVDVPCDARASFICKRME